MDPWLESGPPPDWAGDVHLGVTAWTGGRSGAAGGRQDSGAEHEATSAVEQETKARGILLDTLAGRARSRAELTDKLRAKGIDEAIASQLLDRFEDVGLVDDAAFAATWVEQRHTSKGLARRALSQELRHKGVADDIVRDAVAELDPDSEERAARDLVRRRLRSLRRCDDATATRRLVGMLARKGYPPGLAYAAVRDELGRADRTLPDHSELSDDPAPAETT